MNSVAKVVSYTSLLVMVILPILVFAGTITIELNKTLFLILTITWFVSAPVWMLKRRKG